MDSLYSDRLDLSAHATGASNRSLSDLPFLVCAGLLLWFWILSFYRLALAGEKVAGRNRPSQFVRELLLEPDYRTKTGPDADWDDCNTGWRSGFSGFDCVERSRLASKPHIGTLIGEAMGAVSKS